MKINCLKQPKATYKVVKGHTQSNEFGYKYDMVIDYQGFFHTLPTILVKFYASNLVNAWLLITYLPYRIVTF